MKIRPLRPKPDHPQLRCFGGQEAKGCVVPSAKWKKSKDCEEVGKLLFTLYSPFLKGSLPILTPA